MRNALRGVVRAWRPGPDEQPETVTDMKEDKRQRDLAKIHFAERLKKLRCEHHLTQKEAAMKIGVAYSTYQRFEAGNFPNKNNLKRICEVFGCSTEFLLFGRTEDKRQLNRQDGAYALGDGLGRIESRPGMEFTVSGLLYDISEKLNRIIELLEKRN